MKAGYILSISLSADKAMCCNITAAGSKASVNFHPCDLYPSLRFHRPYTYHMVNNNLQITKHLCTERYLFQSKSLDLTVLLNTLFNKTPVFFRWLIN